MAIQVNGETVINNSRELENITNLRTINNESILGSGNISVALPSDINQNIKDLGNSLLIINSANQVVKTIYGAWSQSDLQKIEKGRLAAIGHIKSESIGGEAKSSFISSISSSASGQFRYNYTNTMCASNNPVIHAGSDDRQSGFGGGDRTLWFYVYSYTQSTTFTEARFRYMRAFQGNNWAINHCSMFSHCYFN